MPHTIRLHALYALLGTLPLRAIILYGLDNSANLTDPGTGVPFDAVARISNSSNQIQGSAVHLGNGYMLTAHHVNLSTSSLISFDGVNNYLIDSGFSFTQVAPNVDLKIFRLATTPAVSSVQVYTGVNEAAASATLVGWGLGRDPSVPVNSATVAWGSVSTSAKRWGLNEPKSLATITYGTGSYQAWVTYLGSATGSPSGLGDSEAAATLYDSGAALFQYLDSTWQLIGIATGVETMNSSTFGNDASDATSDNNYFVRVSTYSGEILSIIPEPGSLGLGAMLLVLGGLVGARRGRRAKPGN